MKSHDYVHVVTFEDTNLTGSVYFVNHLRWQGLCREHFLREHAPGILRRLEEDFVLATVRCSCDYLVELRAFDEIVVRMTLGGIVQNRILLRFEYRRGREPDAEIVARGEQEIACMRREAGDIVATPVPAELRDALRPYMPD